MLKLIQDVASGWRWYEWALLVASATGITYEVLKYTRLGCWLFGHSLPDATSPLGYTCTRCHRWQVWRWLP